MAATLLRRGLVARFAGSLGLPGSLSIRSTVSKKNRVGRVGQKFCGLPFAATGLRPQLSRCCGRLNTQHKYATNGIWETQQESVPNYQRSPMMQAPVSRTGDATCIIQKLECVSPHSASSEAEHGHTQRSIAHESTSVYSDDVMAKGIPLHEMHSTAIGN